MKVQPVARVTLDLAGKSHQLQLDRAWLVTQAEPQAGGVHWRRPRPGGRWRLNLDGPDEASYLTLMRMHRELSESCDVTVQLADGRTATGEAEAASVAPGAAILVGRSELEMR